MKSRFLRTFAWARQHYIWSIIIVIALGIIFTKVFGSSASTVDTVTLTPQTFVRTVAVAGKVTPADDVELGFETTGRIAAVYKKEGDRAYEGETLALVSSSDASADVLKAQADLDAEVAKLNELQNNINGGGTSLLNSQRELFEAISDAYTRSDNAVRNNVDQFYDNPRDNNPEIVFAFNDDALRKELNKTRKTIEFMLVDWKSHLDSLNATTFTDADVTLSEHNLSSVKSFLDRVALAVNDFQVVGSSYSQNDIDKFKSDVSSARTSVNLAISNLVNTRQSVHSVESEIPYQEARVKAAQATVNSFRSELAKRAITAPFNGLVTKQDAKVGQIVNANTVVMRLISDATFTIETYVPEINIKEVQVGNLAKVTLDAYGDEQVFEAKVVSVDPGETIRDGVSTYKVLFEFTHEDDRLKSGMTANVIITTETKEGALLIPQEAVTRRNGFSYVKVMVGKETVEKQITTGTVASNGFIEVVAGLAAGEVVIKNAQ
ncbi:MAG: hypothetical protein RLY57_199 [Candidatus Parcubacteria bacterium]|jgi:RND family efflux transporter MFP subunit